MYQYNFRDSGSCHSNLVVLTQPDTGASPLIRAWRNLIASPDPAMAYVMCSTGPMFVLLRHISLSAP